MKNNQKNQKMTPWCVWF